MTRRPWDVEPDRVEVEKGRRLSNLADEIERCRRVWHAARAARDDVYRQLHEAEQAEVLAALAYRAAVTEYEAAK